MPTWKSEKIKKMTLKWVLGRGGVVRNDKIAIDENTKQNIGRNNYP